MPSTAGERPNFTTFASQFGLRGYCERSGCQNRSGYRTVIPARVPFATGAGTGRADYICQDCYDANPTWRSCASCHSPYDPALNDRSAEQYEEVSRRYTRDSRSYQNYQTQARIMRDNRDSLCDRCAIPCEMRDCDDVRAVQQDGQRRSNWCARHTEMSALGQIFACFRCGNGIESANVTHINGSPCCAACAPVVEREERQRREAESISSYSTDPIQKYGFKFPEPKKRFKGTQAPLMLGIELELECDTNPGVRFSAAKMALERLPNQCIVKNDGSLSHGIEIVSVPLEGQAAANVYFDALFQDDNLPGTKVRSSCGMHVHISRNALDATHIGRLVAFFYNRRNGKLLDKAAGRNLLESSYCNRAGVGGDHTSNGTWAGVMGLNRRGRNLDSFHPSQKRQCLRTPPIGRYTAINFQRTPTIEYRIFAGTNEAKVAKRNVEFVLATVEFTRPGTRPYTDLGNPVKFLEFIQASRKAYPRLYRLFSKKLRDAEERKPEVREMRFSEYETPADMRLDTLLQACTRRVTPYEAIIAKQKEKNERAKRSQATFQGLGDAEAERALRELYEQLNLVYRAATA